MVEKVLTISFKRFRASLLSAWLKSSHVTRAGFIEPDGVRENTQDIGGHILFKRTRSTHSQMFFNPCGLVADSVIPYNKGEIGNKPSSLMNPRQALYWETIEIHSISSSVGLECCKLTASSAFYVVERSKEGPKNSPMVFGHKGFLCKGYIYNKPAHFHDIFYKPYSAYDSTKFTVLLNRHENMASLIIFSAIRSAYKICIHRATASCSKIWEIIDSLSLNMCTTILESRYLKRKSVRLILLLPNSFSIMYMYG